MTPYSNGAPKVCIERALPLDRHRWFPVLRRNGRNASPPSPARLWITGSTLRVGFAGGEAWQHRCVEEEAAAWMEHANLRFAFTDGPEAEIRIGFAPHQGTWSFLGTDALGVPHDRPTMNLAFLEPGVAAHAVGHAMGLEHEHQNPRGGALWNEPAVLEDLARLNGCLDPAEARHQILARHALDRVRGESFDSQSVMRFYHPAHWTRHGDERRVNPTLSDQDKAYIASSAGYPDGGRPRLTELRVNARYSHQAANGAQGEEDVFVFHADKAGRYSVETGGHTHLVMKLFGPDSQTRLLALDDDSGAEFNAHLLRWLAPGRYFVQIRHCNGDKGVGEYRIRVRMN